MELDDLKATWQKEVDMSTQIMNFEQIQTEVDKLDRTAKYSWLREGFGGIVGVLGIVFYVWVYIDNAGWLLQLGAVCLILPIAWSVKRFFNSQKTTTKDDWTVMARIEQQIQKRQKDVDMLSNLAVWHLIPVFLGGSLFAYGVYVEKTGNQVPSTFAFACWMVALAYFVFLHFLNRRTLNKKFRPGLEKLLQIRAALRR